MIFSWQFGTWCLLAEGEAAAPGGSLSDMMPAFAVMGLLFYFMMIRPESRKREAARVLLAQLKKNDRVITVGGVYGVVTNVQRDADRVTLRVDESNNTKLDVTLGSIARVIVDEPAAEKAAT